MTDRQRMEALLNRQKPDRVPTWPMGYYLFAALQAKASLSEAYNNPEVIYPIARKACRDFGWVFLPYMVCGAMGAWEFGGEIKWPKDEYSMAPSIVRYPVETPDVAMRLQMPDIKNSGFVPILMKLSKISATEMLDNGTFNVSCAFMGPFSLAANLAGPENFVKWLIKESEAAHFLLRLATDYLVELFIYWKDTFGAGGVLPILGEPSASNQMISPEHFEKFAFTYIKELHEEILSMGYETIFCHICGEQNLNLPYWAQIPMGYPGIVSVGHEVDLEIAAKYFPSDIIFGNLEPTIIQTQSPDGVYQASREVIEKGKKLSTGFIFSTGCTLPPRVNPANVIAITEAVNKYGWYE